MATPTRLATTAQVRVTTQAGPSASRSDRALDRFQATFGQDWVPGRLSVARLHVTFVPTHAGRHAAVADVDLHDVRVVELRGGRTQRVLALRTETHVVHVRCSGVTALATQVADLVALTHRQTRGRR